MAGNDKALSLRAAWYSFGLNMKQQDVASLLGLSRSKANRLVSSVKESHSIYYSIDGNPGELLGLEEQLSNAFDLKTCAVCDAPVKEDPFYSLGGTSLIEEGAHQLRAIMATLEATSVGFGKSRTVKKVVERLSIPYQDDYSWIGLQGCFGANLETNPFEIIADICDKAGGQGYLLPVSAALNSYNDAQMAFKVKEVSDVLLKAKKASLYVLSIGSIQNTEAIADILGFSEQQISNLRHRNVVGDILGHFLDSRGQQVTGNGIPTALSLALSDLKKNRTFVVAGGDAKADALIASLRGGYISDLVTDSQTAKQVLKEVVT